MSFENALPKEINGLKVDGWASDDWPSKSRFTGFAIYIRNGDDRSVQSVNAWARIVRFSETRSVRTSHCEEINSNPSFEGDHPIGSSLYSLAESVLAGGPVQPLIDWVLENQIMCFGKEII